MSSKTTIFPATLPEGMKCQGCDITYPTGYVMPMTLQAGENYMTYNVCGICALEITNVVHQITRKHFTERTAAESIRMLAVRFRAKHPEQPPKHMGLWDLPRTQ